MLFALYNVDISIAGGGQHEIERHMKTEKHSIN